MCRAETQDVKRLRALESENAQLKKLLAERDLAIDAARALFRKAASRSRTRLGGSSSDGFEPVTPFDANGRVFLRLPQCRVLSLTSGQQIVSNSGPVCPEA